MIEYDQVEDFRVRPKFYPIESAIFSFIIPIRSYFRQAIFLSTKNLQTISIITNLSLLLSSIKSSRFMILLFMKKTSDMSLLLPILISTFSFSLDLTYIFLDQSYMYSLKLYYRRLISLFSTRAQLCKRMSLLANIFRTCLIPDAFPLFKLPPPIPISCKTHSIGFLINYLNASFVSNKLRNQFQIILDRCYNKRSAERQLRSAWRCDYIAQVITLLMSYIIAFCFVYWATANLEKSPGTYYLVTIFFGCNNLKSQSYAQPQRTSLTLLELDTLGTLVTIGCLLGLDVEPLPPYAFAQM